MRHLKIILSVLFVLCVSLFIVRACVHKKPAYREIEKPAPIIKKKVIHKKAELKTEKIAMQPSKEIAEGPRMAIILDDWGINFSLTKMAEDIHRPMTLSILPHLVNSERIAEEAYQNNLDVMLHMPMQPKNKTRGLEPHTIMLTNSDETIIAYLDSALASVPHAVGVNNHMGSAATSDVRVMRTVLSHLLAKGLFFVDSDTTSSTVASQVAKEVGINFSKRDVFIDNDPSREAVERQLMKAKAIAVKHGRVIVIGHDKKVTLNAIKEMVPAIEKDGVRLVFIKDLLE